MSDSRPLSGMVILSFVLGGGLLLGMGVGLAIGQTTAGLFVGLGAGLMIAAFMMFQNKA